MMIMTKSNMRVYFVNATAIHTQGNKHSHIDFLRSCQKKNSPAGGCDLLIVKHNDSPTIKDVIVQF